MSETSTYTLERVFDAPREMVWRGWTEPELFARWYGPRAETVVHRSDLEAGGLWLVEMRMGDNSVFQRFECAEVTPPERLVWRQSVSDADWNVIANPMLPDWPRVVLSTVTLDRDGARTRMRFTWAPHEANEAQHAVFAGAMGEMGRGWEAGMKLLADILVELQR
ncbi:MAG: SRPBCC domain-containing protein [Acidobacteria bacterium]|nr:SRPBCC domain-containing protein [Acidobacteriota bacterium]